MQDVFVRYELYIDDEPQGIGFLQGIGELDVDDDYIETLLHPFNTHLYVPESIFAKYRHTKSWFTLDGEKEFFPYINTIVNLFDSMGLFHIERLVVNNINNIVYQDDYQIIQQI